MICLPSKRANIITQTYSEKHKAVDWFLEYGEFLVAPFNGRVIDIITDENIYDCFWNDFRRGYGIVMKSDTENLYVLYWHCLQAFPVNKQQVIRQGQPVAQAGNSGLCYSNNVLVKDEDKLKPPFPGTHLHEEVFTSNPDGTRTYIDPLTIIDWSIKINYSVLDAIRDTLNKIASWFKS
jgi:murein DD-endopeptidase MepM/ murein hydrolase activator NlpD